MRHDKVQERDIVFRIDIFKVRIKTNISFGSDDALLQHIFKYIIKCLCWYIFIKININFNYETFPLKKFKCHFSLVENNLFSL